MWIGNAIVGIYADMSKMLAGGVSASSFFVYKAN